MKNINYILGIGAIIILTLIGFFVFSNGSAKYISEVDSALEDLGEQLADAQEEISTGTLTTDKATAIKEKISGRLTIINNSIAGASRNTQLNTEQRLQIAASLTKMKNMLEQYIETLSVIDQSAGRSDERLTQSFNEVVQTFEEHVEEIEREAEAEAIEGDGGEEENNEEDLGQIVPEEGFEGEADPSVMTLGMTTWNWIQTTYNNGDVVEPDTAGEFTLIFNDDGTFSATTDCNGVGGNYTTGDGQQLTFGEMVSTLMFCEGSQETEFREMLENTSSYSFTSRGELVLDLKFDSGSVIFR
ncbi:MAG: hypothetical protein COV34_01710 [Candidatus Zambryskibacteria bacterium CG10_big_fil_rev_8_21_14_0_10_42_12]|uniref:DUF306 domain-containing protein n=1 Tax=Candidatus Zambryskibacteria bacterium CG10_big_fil_rev_8_21_14_0_10_42_12 TaxID=1975115 RepID=A0A2H0QWV7_9BACT|nr:MAG: hypothetical protein COV34_01710 [Candidatus Zambryskibacteria bacterium CG10_big_fil_rev_8_21_14_0_10_42_12]